MEPPLKRQCRLASFQPLFRECVQHEHQLYHRTCQQRYQLHGRRDVSNLAEAAAYREEDGQEEAGAASSQTSDGHVTRGERRFLYFMQLMRNGFLYEPSLFQTEFLMMVAQILSPMVVGAEDWPHVGPKLAQRYQWKLSRLNSMLLAKAPRRFGKTVALSIAGAAFGLCAPHRKSAILSIAKRISRYMGEMIYGNLVKAGWQDLILRFGEEELVLLGEDRHDLRHFYCYPGNSSKLRGITAHFLLCDEAAFMDTDLFFKIIMPLYEVDDTALVCISSPGRAFGFYATLISMMNPYTGERMLPAYEVELICPRCRTLQRPRCPHQNKYYPKWKRMDKQRIIQEIVPASIYGAEIMGQQMEDDRGRVFHERFLEQLEFNPPYSYNVNLPPRNVLVTMDPNAGGPNSCAIVSTVEHGGVVVIVGMDAWPTQSTELAPFLKAHLEALSRHPWLQQANLLFMGERNSGGSVGTILHYMRDVPRFVPLKQDPKKDYGFFTDARNKPHMATAAAQRVQEGAVFYLEDMVVSNVYERERNPRWTTQDLQRRIKDAFVDQLRRMRYHLSMPKTAQSQARMAVSGKLDDEGRPRDGFDDDMAIAFCMNLYVWQQLRQRVIKGVPYDVLFPRQVGFRASRQ